MCVRACMCVYVCMYVLVSTPVRVCSCVKAEAGICYFSSPYKSEEFLLTISSSSTSSNSFIPQCLMSTDTQTSRDTQAERQAHKQTDRHTHPRAHLSPALHALTHFDKHRYVARLHGLSRTMPCLHTHSYTHTYAVTRILREIYQHTFSTDRQVHI